MKIIRKGINEIDDELKKQIDKFINENDGLIFHNTLINKIATSFFKSELSYLLAFENKNLIGICPVSSRKIGPLTYSNSADGSFEMMYGGWVFDKTKTNARILYSQKKQKALESISYNPSFLSMLDSENANSEGPFMTGIIDLNLSEEEIWNSVINSKRRNMIRKAEKSGVEIKHFGIEGLPIYFELNKLMRQKVDIKINPIEFYQEILESLFPSRALISIAYHEGIAVSGLILIGNKNVMHYWQGASLLNINLGQGELLQWDAIRWAKKGGSKWYDLGIIEPHKLESIAHFKMGFTKNLIRLERITHKKLSFRVTNKLAKIFHNVAE